MWKSQKDLTVIYLITVNIQQMLFKLIRGVNYLWGFLDVQDTFEPNPEKKWASMRLKIQTIEKKQKLSSEGQI